MKDPLVRHLVRLAGGPDGTQDPQRGALAALRRGLGGHAGARVAMARHVEPFLGKAPAPWQRESAYQVAALFAQHPHHRGGSSFPRAMRALAHDRNSESLQKRFQAILAAEGEDLPVHLRHAIQLLASERIPIDYEELRCDLQGWTSPEQWVQERWAQAYWSSGQEAAESSPCSPPASSED